MFYLRFIFSEASAHEGSGSSECTVESRDSPLPSTHDDDENYEPCQRRLVLQIIVVGHLGCIMKQDSTLM